MPPIITEHRRREKVRCEKTTRLPKGLLAITAGAGVIGAILYLSMPSILSYLSERDALRQAASEELHVHHAARKDIVEAIDEMPGSEALRAYGLRMAVHLQGLIRDDASSPGTLESWESLIREVACANHRFGAKGPMMYVTLREKTFDTEARQALFDRARSEIVREGDRGVLDRAGENLDGCP